MPRSSRPTAHHLANSAPAVTRPPPARAGSFHAPLQTCENGIGNGRFHTQRQSLFHLSNAGGLPKVPSSPSRRILSDRTIRRFLPVYCNGILENGEHQRDYG